MTPTRLTRPGHRQRHYVTKSLHQPTPATPTGWVTLSCCCGWATSLLRLSTPTAIRRAISDHIDSTACQAPIPSAAGPQAAPEPSGTAAHDVRPPDIDPEPLIPLSEWRPKEGSELEARMIANGTIDPLEGDCPRETTLEEHFGLQPGSCGVRQCKVLTSQELKSLQVTRPTHGSHAKRARVRQVDSPYVVGRHLPESTTGR